MAFNAACRPPLWNVYQKYFKLNGQFNRLNGDCEASLRSSSRQLPGPDYQQAKQAETQDLGEARDLVTNTMVRKDLGKNFFLDIDHGDLFTRNDSDL